MLLYTVWERLEACVMKSSSIFFCGVVYRIGVI
jgi:hypothetical protein